MTVLLWMASALASRTETLDIEDVAPAWPEIADTAPPPAGPWWSDLGDPLLDALVSEGLVANPDLGSSRARLMQAQGASMQSFSPLAPSVSFDVGTSGQPADVVFRCAVGPIDPAEFGGTGAPLDGLCWTGSALFNFGWQLDVFGRQATQFAASRYEVAASEGDRDAMALMVSSNVVAAYLDVLTAQAQVEILDSQLSAQSDLLEILELRYEQGGAGGLDVLQQRQSVASTRASLPVARATERSRAAALSALLARPPGSTPEVADALPEPRPVPDPGRPSQLIERRPDLRAASDRVRAARARHTSALVGLAPTVRVSANAGWSYAVADEWSAIETWGLGGNLSVPIFNGGAVHGAIRQASGAEQASARAFDTALLNAVRDVESALVLEQEQALRHAATQDQVEAARLAYDEARERYLQGIDTFLTVLSTQNALLGAELSQLQAHRDRLSARVQLWTALGGTPASGATP